MSEYTHETLRKLLTEFGENHIIVDEGMAHADAWGAREKLAEDYVKQADLEILALRKRLEAGERLLDEVNERLAVLEPKLDRIQRNSDLIIEQRDALRKRLEEAEKAMRFAIGCASNDPNVVAIRLRLSAALAQEKQEADDG